MSTPELSLPDRANTRAVVLLLPGGSGHETGMGRRWRPTILRLVPFGWHVSRAARARGAAVALLRYRVAGWKSGADGALDDTRWALAQIRSRVGPVPVILVGHSMGGRAALGAAADPSVVAVIGLAPWVTEDADPRLFTDTELLILHGDRDRVTNPRASQQFIATVARLGGRAEFALITGDGHAMLRRASTWHRRVAAEIDRVLLPALEATP